MPAAPSSPIDTSIGHLLALTETGAGDRAGLLSVLAQVPDPRKPRGVRHRLATVLGLAVCAVMAGARSYVAIAEWAADADVATLTDLGVGPVVACESTFRRTLQCLDADALDDAVGAWTGQRTSPPPGQRRRIAVDGKTLRGSATGGEPGRHLLAALDHAHAGGPWPGRRGDQDERDPVVRNAFGPHRPDRRGRDRGRAARPTRPRPVLRGRTWRALRADRER